MPFTVARSVPILLMILGAADPGVTAAPSFTASYTIFSHGLSVGKLERSLVVGHDGSYIFRSDGYATGLAALFYRDRVREESISVVRNGQLRPVKYSYRQSGGRKSRAATVTFDWDAGKIKNRVNDRAWQAPIRPGTVDKLLYELMLMRDVRNGGHQFEYRIADGDEIKTYAFVRSGEEVITTPLGSFRTLKLERVNMTDKRKATVWSAPGLHYLPVRVDNVGRDGRATSVVIESVKGITPH